MPPEAFSLKTKTHRVDQKADCFYPRVSKGGGSFTLPACLFFTGNATPGAEQREAQAVL